LSFEYFISKRILKNELQGKKVSQAIVRISIISIALAIVVNLLTIAVVKGFQNQVRDKVSGFGAHLSIMSASSQTMSESYPIIKNQAFFDGLKKNPAIQSISRVAYKPVLFQSERQERVVNRVKHSDTTIVEQNVHGALLKGVENEFDWTFFQQYLIAGELPHFKKEEVSDEILVSKKIATILNYQLGDTVKAYFVRNNPILKKLIIKGIFETGLEDHDTKIAIGDLRLTQELNDWGIQASATIDDTLFRVKGYEDQLILRVKSRGGQGQFRYDWGEGNELYAAKTINVGKDTTYRIIVSDFRTSLLNDVSLSVPDTTYLSIKIKGDKSAVNRFELEDNQLVKKYLDDSGTRYQLQAGTKIVEIEERAGKGSYTDYVAGFELKVKDWSRLEQTHKEIKKQVEFMPSERGETFRVETIKQTENDIFVWLDFLNINVVIILVLMILIGIINMGSALLVLILVRTNFIGILKSLGANNWSIRKVFLIQASFLIIRGMLIGNIIGLGLAFIQYYFELIPLNPEVYYLNTVPIELSFMNWLLLNLGTLFVCVVALIVPSMVITKITPSKAIRFN
jgi:lipoprotein-releasing system permease protein